MQHRRRCGGSRRSRSGRRGDRANHRSPGRLWGSGACPEQIRPARYWI